MESSHALTEVQAEAGAAGNASPPADQHLLSNKASDHLSNERTFLAGVRTALATITFGFVVERLPPPGAAGGGKAQPGLVSWAPFSAVVGTSLSVLGLLMLGLALLNFLHIRANIDRDAFHPPIRFVVLLAILAGLIGLLLAVYLLLTL